MRDKTSPRAPYGYAIGLNEGGKVVLAPDPIQAEIVRSAYADRTRSRLGLAVVELMRAVRQRIGRAAAIVGG
jgi:hypothetical protein